MKNVYQGLQYVGILTMLIFGGTFILRWMLQDELLLDQLIGFTVGLVALVIAYIVKHRNRQHTI
ncbi:hypothetical protein [Ectobacillus panaciterrae]|uniref:hypothetical protein n=1 Tax=Ectobacillus panaciterrae TaxID=363872 RepID=UPI000490AEAF|nr:hypothetical protein [Ectobacillus panaciterrae]